MLVERCRHGFRLVESPSDPVHASNSLASLFDLPIPVYFYDTDSNFIGANEHNAELVDATSAADMLGKSPFDFCSKEFSKKIIAIDDAVIRNQSTHIVEETGFRADDFLIQTLSFKLPWYHDDKVIGLLGFSIVTDHNSVNDFAARMASVLATGVLGSASISNVAPMISHQDIYFSRRETEVLAYLLRGCTAKMIGERLNLSKRTVEHHIDHIKHKSNCKTKFELIEKFHGLIDLVP